MRVMRLPYPSRRKGAVPWPQLPGYERVNVCSSGTWGKELSPFFLRPTDLVAPDFETLWQASKMYPCDEMPGTDTPNERFYKRQRNAFERARKHGKGLRHVGPRGVKPVCAWYGRRLSYLEARRQIYVPTYVALARETSAFRRLRDMVASGTNVLLIGYDGYDYRTDGKTLAQCMDDETRSFGHELVLAGMLTGELAIESE